jgi:7,8-dihydropterin-6-yl-methyl-4-(beta-D-ribofuranosyl)aminobenzene 5'-phosphate synthase
MEASMLFGDCNCVPESTFLSAYGSLCAGGAGFVSAMIGAMVAGARTAES